MRTKKELEDGRKGKIGMEPATHSYADTAGNSYEQGDLIPQLIAKGETFEEQILEVLLDIREMLT